MELNRGKRAENHLRVHEHNFSSRYRIIFRQILFPVILLLQIFIFYFFLVVYNLFQSWRHILSPATCVKYKGIHWRPISLGKKIYALGRQYVPRVPAYLLPATICVEVITYVVTHFPHNGYGEHPFIYIPKKTQNQTFGIDLWERHLLNPLPDYNQSVV